MERLGMLIGIGLMLVGACALALPQEVDLTAILPTAAGCIIGVVSAIGTHFEECRKHVIHVNGCASLLLFVFILIRAGPDIEKFHKGSIVIVSDLDILFLASVFLLISISTLIRDILHRRFSRIR